jgi:hypothetical protein
MSDATIQAISFWVTFIVGTAIVLPFCLKWRKKTHAPQCIVVSEVHAVEYPATTETRTVTEPIRLFSTPARNISIAFCAFASPIVVTYMVWSAMSSFMPIVSSLPKQAIITFQIVLIMVLAVFAVGCLRMSAYYLSQLIAPVPWIVLDGSGLAVEASFLRYSFDWSNLKCARIVEQGEFRRMEIVLKSVEPLYAKKHSSILKLEIQVNLKLRQSHLVIFGGPKAAKVQFIDLDQIMTFMASRINPGWDPSNNSQTNLTSSPSSWPPPPTN